LSGSLYIESSGRSFLSSSIAIKRRSTATGLSAVSCAVLAVFLIILGSKAAEGAPFCSQGVLDTSIRLDLRRIMLEDRLYGVVPFRKKLGAKSAKKF
jgi:hypothetical protein